MNPDNPNFRTPEEEARAAELVKLKAEVARQAKVIEKLREQRDVELEDNCWNRGNGNIDNARRKYESELKAIEQGEGM